MKADTSSTGKTGGKAAFEVVETIEEESVAQKNVLDDLLENDDEEGSAASVTDGEE